MTETKKVQLPVFLALSVDEQFTVVMPIRKLSSDEWEQVTLASASAIVDAVALITTPDDEFSPGSVVEVTF